MLTLHRPEMTEITHDSHMIGGNRKLSRKSTNADRQALETAI